MKLLLVCTSGGHFATMSGLKSFWSLHDRVWATDLKTDTEVLKGEERVHWMPYQGPRNLLKFVLNIPLTFNIILRERPDFIISTGASVAVNFAFIAKILGIRFAYVESISRSKKLSLSGQLVYLVGDEFYVQWPDLCRKYPKAIFRGYV